MDRGRWSTLARIQEALEIAGIIFISADDAGGAGVRSDFANSLPLSLGEKGAVERLKEARLGQRSRGTTSPLKSG